MKTVLVERVVPLESKDRELIRKVAEAEPYFTAHPAHEARAYKLTQRGYLSKEHAVFARAGKRTEYRWQYSLTERGRRELS